MVKEMIASLRRFGERPKIKDTSIIEASYVVIDTELTGLDEKKDSIISIGAIRMKGGRIYPGDNFYRIIKPENNLTKESIIIHGLTPQDLDSGIDIEQALLEFQDFIEDHILVGHCVSIDMAFLNRQLKKLFGKTLKNPLVDTWLLYENLKKRFPSERCLSQMTHNLYDASRCFGIPVENAHNALIDAFITAQFFQRLLPLLQRSGIEKTTELLRIGDPLRGGDRFKTSEIQSL